MEVVLPPIILDEGTGNSMVFFGSSKCGKTTLMCEIVKKLYAGSDYITTLFAGNVQIPEYDWLGKYVLKTGVFNMDSIDYIKSQKFINENTKNKYRFCNIFDDQLELRNSKLINNLIASYRNSDMSTIICLQGPKMLTPAMRSNLNAVVLMWFNSDELVRQIVDIYMADYFKRMGLYKDNFVTEYRRLTKDHHYIYVHILSETVWSSRDGYLFRDSKPKK